LQIWSSSDTNVSLFSSTINIADLDLIKKSLNKMICYSEGYVWRWLPLWSSGQSSWLQIRRPGFDSRHYQIFWEGGKENK
jgi:hypothetical protein